MATREPGSTPLGEQVRRLVLDTEPKIDRTGLTDALLFAASRAQHVAEVIRPALARGAIVVCDRYLDSSMAYQGAGSGLPMDELAAVQRFATGGLVPDLTILLDLPVEVGLARKSAEVTRFEAFQDHAYHERVRAAFLAFAAAEPARYATSTRRSTRSRPRRGHPRRSPGSPTARRACGQPREPAVIVVRAGPEPTRVPGTHDTMSDARLDPRPCRAAPAGSSDEELLAGLAAGRLEALDALYERYRSMAYGIARRITADDTLAEDVVQEAFLGAWRTPDRYVAGKGA